MNKLTLAALSGSAILTLAACDQSAPVYTEDETATDTAMEPIDPVDAMPAEESAPANSISIGPNGVDAQINDGDTSVTADVDDDPSMTVETP